MIDLFISQSVTKCPNEVAAAAAAHFQTASARHCTAFSGSGEEKKNRPGWGNFSHSAAEISSLPTASPLSKTQNFILTSEAALLCLCVRIIGSVNSVYFFFLNGEIRHW